MSTDREPAFVGMYWIGAGLPLEARLAVPTADVPALRARIIAAVEHSPSAAALQAALGIVAREHDLELDFEIADLGRGVVASVRMQPHDRIDVPSGAERTVSLGMDPRDGAESGAGEESTPGTS